MTDLSEDSKLRGSTAIIKALSQGPKSFGELWPVASNAMGFVPNAQESPAYRFADGWLQRNKRAGNIEFARKGRTCVWSLTSAGRDAFATPAQSSKGE